MVPEFILFNNGKPKCLIYYNRRLNEVKAIYDKEKLKHSKIMNFMLRQYNGRRNVVITSKIDNGSKKELLSDNSISALKISSTLMANVRYRNKNIENLLSQKEFIELMMERSSSDIWKNVLFIQSYVEITTFIPKTFIYTYNAPIDIENPKDAILYLENTEQNTTNFDTKAQNICNIIGEYVARTHGIVSLLINIGNTTNENSFYKRY